MPDGPANAKVNGKNAVKFDEPIDLTCVAESVPASTYTWKLNDSMIANATWEKYTVEKASLKDVGTYTCEARNPLTGVTFNTTHKLTVTGKLSQTLSYMCQCCTYDNIGNNRLTL